MGKELDRSFLPKPEPLPDGGVRMRLPDDAEWLAAGGAIKREEQSHSGFEIREDWREHLERWLSKWQEKNKQPGKAPRSFIIAYEELARKEELNFHVDYLNLDDVEDSLRRKRPKLSAGEIKEAVRFIKPMLVDKPWTLRVVHMLSPDRVEEEEG